MIRMERYVHSRRPYAVRLSTFEVERTEWEWQGAMHVSWRLRIRAGWHRGKVAAPETCLGWLTWTTSDDPWRHFDPKDILQRDLAAEDAVKAYADGRYGGTCIAKSTGRGLWFADVTSPRVLQGMREELTEIADAFPQPPAGYSGWWTFQGAS